MNWVANLKTKSLTARAFCALALMTATFAGQNARADIRCENLFEVTGVQTETPSEMAQLQRAQAELETEQAAARDRDWKPEQLEEIRLKSRINFEEPERAIKYYRGLIVWKLRDLANAVQERTDDQTMADYKAKWPEKLKVEETLVSFFINQPEFLHALELTKSVLGVQNPSPEQLAAVMVTMTKARSQKRMSWVDPAKFENAATELLRPHFPSVTVEQIREIAKNPNPKFRDLGCCGTGNCVGCTHPNVVFRDTSVWHGPAHLDPANLSTLPLYRTMDRLKLEFPDEPFGVNFWDARVEFETKRLKPESP